MDTTIVVGYDGTAPSERALVEAGREASLRKCPLTVVHAFHWVTPATPITFTPPRLEDVCREAAERIVTDGADMIRYRYPDVTVTTRAVAGYAPDVLADASRDAALLVVGNRGRGGFESLLLGSVSIRVLGRAAGPVLVVRGGEHEARDRVLVAVDLDDCGDVLLDFAFAEASRRGVPLRAVHVWDEPYIYGHATDLRESTTEIAEAVTDLGARLDALVQVWRDKYPEVEARHEVAVGSSGAVLIEASTSADLAVVGARGHGGDGHGVRIGPVAHTLLLHADCPVAVVPMG